MIASGVEDEEDLGKHRKVLQERFLDGFSLSGYERDFVALSRRGEGHLVISGVSGADSIRDSRSGTSYIDLDNDGDLDILKRPSSHPDPPLMLYRNNVGHEAGFLRISLQGKADRSGLDAWTAVVRVKSSQGTLTKMKAAGSGFMAQWDPRLVFGLGNDERSGAVEVAWPSGLRQSFEGFTANSSVLLVEGEVRPHLLDEPKGKLPDPLTLEEKKWLSVSVRPGQTPPKMILRSLDGTETTLDQVVTPGHRTLINLWATWCIPCRAEMPELQALFEEGLPVVGISVDDVEAQGTGTVQAFTDSVGVSYPVYVADHEQLGMLFATSVINVPISLVISETSKIEDIIVGWTAEAERRLRSLTSGQ